MEIGIWGCASNSRKVGGGELVRMKRNHEKASVDGEDVAYITITFKFSTKKSIPYISTSYR